MVVRGNIVGIAARGDTSGAKDVGAAILGWHKCQAPVLEGVAVDVGDIVPESVGEGVLKLRDRVLGLIARDLDRDTTTISVGAIRLRVVAAVGIERLHGVDLVGDRPQVDGEVALVLNDGLAQRTDSGDGGHDGGSGERGVHVVQRNAVLFVASGA